MRVYTTHTCAQHTHTDTHTLAQQTVVLYTEPDWDSLDLQKGPFQLMECLKPLRDLKPLSSLFSSLSISASLSSPPSWLCILIQFLRLWGLRYPGITAFKIPPN